MEEKVIIGLSGYARSGKDSVANILVEEFAYRKTAYADKLREALYELNPIVSTVHNAHGFVMLKEVIDWCGWDGYKETEYKEEIRRLIQRLGTEVGRNLLGESIWVDATLAGIEREDVVIPDVRFPNEAQAIVDRHGELWRIKRPGVDAANEHSSETSLDHWSFDKTIYNVGSLDELSAEVHRAMFWDL